LSIRFRELSAEDAARHYAAGIAVCVEVLIDSRLMTLKEFDDRVSAKISEMDQHAAALKNKERIDGDTQS
jgi:hypothetical protein